MNGGHAWTGCWAITMPWDNGTSASPAVLVREIWKGLDLTGIQLSNWQNQTLLSAVGWRGQTYINGFDLNAIFGIENRQSHSSGQVSDGIGTQDITDLPAGHH